MNQIFNVGAKVKCITAMGAELLKEGEIYTVRGMFEINGTPFVQLVGIAENSKKEKEDGWYTYRFELCSQEDIKINSEVKNRRRLLRYGEKV